MDETAPANIAYALLMITTLYSVDREGIGELSIYYRTKQFPLPIAITSGT
jgi:hypothetical protein